MSHPEHDEHQFSPSARAILDGLAEQYDSADISFTNETCVDLCGPFDVEELAEYLDKHISARIKAALDYVKED